MFLIGLFSSKAMVAVGILSGLAMGALGLVLDPFKVDEEKSVRIVEVGEGKKEIWERDLGDNKGR